MGLEYVFSYIWKICAIIHWFLYIHIPKIKKKVVNKWESGIVFISLVRFYNRECCQWTLGNRGVLFHEVWWETGVTVLCARCWAGCYRTVLPTSFTPDHSEEKTLYSTPGWEISNSIEAALEGWWVKTTGLKAGQPYLLAPRAEISISHSFHLSYWETLLYGEYAKVSWVLVSWGAQCLPLITQACSIGWVQC